MDDRDPFDTDESTHGQEQLADGGSIAETEDVPRRLSALTRPGDTVMVVDLEHHPAARPVTVAHVDDGSVTMLIDRTAEWARNLSNGASLLVTLSDNRRNTWLSLNGTAMVTDDPAVIDELWNVGAEAYFDEGRNTPGIAVLIVTISSGSYWSSPSGRIGTLVSMVRAAVGNSDDSGQHGSVDVA
jgi:general stress protein 26